MEKRLVVFLIFLVFLSGILSLISYRKHHDPERISTISYEALMAEKKVEEVKEVIVDRTEILMTKGKELYHSESAACVTCHGQNGEGMLSQEAPRIGGQHSWYLQAQLQDMKAGVRVNEKMNPYLETLNQEDLEALSVYVASLR